MPVICVGVKKFCQGRWSYLSAWRLIKGVKVIFWGTRGSWPVVGSAAPSAFASHHTPCVELESGESLIMDAGSALGPALRSAYDKGQREFSILLSHYHWDHLLGLISIYDLFSSGIKLKIYTAQPEPEQTISMLYQSAYCPVDWRIIFRSFEFHQIKEEVEIGKYKVRFGEVPHTGLTFGFQIEQAGKKVIYMSDVDLHELKKNPFGEAPDLLICDSFHLQEDKQVRGGWGHSTAVEAVQFAHKIKARQLALFHYSPTYRANELQKLLEEATSANNKVLELHMPQDGEYITL